MKYAWRVNGQSLVHGESVWASGLDSVSVVV
jgi:hypothetical protein